MNDQPKPAAPTHAFDPDLTKGLANDCWNIVGVQGDSSCPELQGVHHCRNCPTYSRAALQILSRPIPAGFQREWTEHFSQPRHRAPVANNSVVVFRAGHEWLAMPTHAFQEAAEKRAIHSIPHGRNSIVLGLTNVRGELLICISISRVLGSEQSNSVLATSSPYNRLLVTNWEGQRLCFPADEVGGLHRFPSEELSKPPLTLAKSGVSLIEGLFSWRGKTVGMLNADLLFSAISRNLA